MSAITIGGLAAGLAAGVLLGSLYFGGLWWTLTCIGRARYPAGLLLLSLLLRLGVAGAGILWAVRAGAGELLGCLAGILLVREILKRRASGGRPLPGAALPDGRD